MKKRFWRCYLCEKNFFDEEMKGPLIFRDKGNDYFICYCCGKDMALRTIKQKRYLLLECPRCFRAFLPLLDFDTDEFRSKVFGCPFCKEKSTFKFIPKPGGSILQEKSPEEYE